MPTVKPLENKYNYLTVLDDERIHRGNCVYVKCRCECGVTKEVNIKNLRSGQVKSCGCLAKKVLSERNTKHNKRFTKTWRAWQAMKNRCYNKNLKQYHQYGGRGIKVCDEWRNDFMSFYNHVGESPTGKSLDRIDNDGDYEPGNVRWATSKEQCKNKGNNRKINGVCISEISMSLGGRDSLVAKRLTRGWPIERAITEKTNAGS